MGWVDVPLIFVNGRGVYAQQCCWVFCEGAMFLKMPMSCVHYLVIDLVLVLISYLLCLSFLGVAECTRNDTFAMSEV